MAVENKMVKLEDAKKSVVISFSDSDHLEGFDWEHDDPIVITVAIHNYVVKRILVNQGSSTNILYNITAIGMNIFKANLKPHLGNLINFF